MNNRVNIGGYKKILATEIIIGTYPKSEDTIIGKN